jgi:hypothetical protein
MIEQKTMPGRWRLDRAADINEMLLAVADLAEERGDTLLPVVLRKLASGHIEAIEYTATGEHSYELVQRWTIRIVQFAARIM